MPDAPREPGFDDDPLRYLEALLRAILFSAGAYVATMIGFLFRPDRFDAAVRADPERERQDAPPRYLGPLSFLLLNQVRLLPEDAEEALDPVEPGRAGWRVVKAHARIGGQPLSNRRRATRRGPGRDAQPPSP
jgi:hypothetical protein